MHLTDAANVMTPAYLAIIAKGFAVRSDGNLLIAERGGDTFAAEGFVALLGLIAVVEARGVEWQATDCEISDFVSRFG